MFIADDFTFGDESGRFVQTRIRKMEQGPTDLNVFWKDRIAASNDTNQV